MVGILNWSDFFLEWKESRVDAIVKYRFALNYYRSLDLIFLVFKTDLSVLSPTPKIRNLATGLYFPEWTMDWIGLTWFDWHVIFFIFISFHTKKLLLIWYRSGWTGKTERQSQNHFTYTYTLLCYVHLKTFLLICVWKIGR